MIVPITGKVSYSITLDPTVWIFDDRKILLEEAFSVQVSETEENNELEKLSERFNREVLETKMNRPPVNRSISKLEGEKILKNSYVMPLQDFISNAEIKPEAQDATLVTGDDEGVTITLDELKNGYFLFAQNGKPLKEDGPVHYFYKDGSNKNNPITNIKKIVIN
ncbi:hypothetical protein [Oceanobacillus saliphilus]|uniref:hypothetical protein n=1 Tax=Oceanobacillus saliphilus TaxID=2925834 RepID=UPI00201D4F59|nr:hypothetical protein [Oceanobacillus saliphilus]